MIKFDIHIHFDFFPSKETIIKYYNDNKIFALFATLSPQVFMKYKKSNIESDYIKISLGAHPCYLDDYTFNYSDFERALLNTKYVSEIGLDFTKDYVHNKKEQLRIFNFICSRSINKLLVIHSRKAEKEIYNILSKNNNKYFVIHWYSGTLDYMQKFINLGAYFSVNHKMISTKKISKYINLIPLDRLLVETDAPFSLDNDRKFDYEECYSKIVEYISKFKKMDKNAIKKILSENFYKLIVAVNDSNSENDI